MSTAGSPPAATAGSPASNVDVKISIPRRPSLIMKPASSPSATSPPPTSASGTMSLTSKEWVIPPRPKPGRKPATDTPPSKRKAQNRAAQRAFRERRAQRVSELEDQMKGIQDDHDKEQDNLRDRIHQLEQDLEEYRSELAIWTDKCRRLENENNALRSGNHEARTNSIKPVAPEPPVGCGKCTLDTRCQCIEDAFNVMAGEEAHPSTDKRPHSPDHTKPEKRIKTESNESLEIDFTAMYSSKAPLASTQNQVSPSSAVADPCGFCSDGTPCICAEMAAEQNQPQPSTRQATTLHPSQFTPPPSEGDVAPPTVTVPSNACINGPGTCTQCLADPNSTLFCKSLAASRGQSQASGCCGSRTPGGSCCQSTDAVPLARRTTRSRVPVTNSTSNSKSTVTLTCADAYTTLSRHPAYERATSDIATWLPKLHASNSATGGKLQGRPAMEIDAANVMSVLKDFDRRFGKSV